MNDAPLPLTEHLAELRSRLVRCLLAWAAGSALAWNFREEVFGLLLRPALQALGGGERPLQAIAPGEIFFTYMKSALLAGFVFALPVLFWQLWAFVAPGLYAREKRVALPFAFISTALFAGGASFGYAVVFPVVFGFLSSFDSDFAISAWTMREVFSFTSHLFLAFGIAFELPIVVFFLSLAGIADARTLWRSTPYAILAIFVVAAILTPPDWISQVLLGTPMVFLYLLGVGAAFLVEKKEKKIGDESRAVS